MKRGHFLVFEGIEGSGKSTQAARLAEQIETTGRPVVLTREPGGTAIGEKIRDLFLARDLGEMDAKSEAFLNVAARAQHVSEVIQPALERGETVISDRFGDSTLAYQGGGRELPIDSLRRMHEFATGGIEPDLRILLDVDVERGLERRKSQLGSDNRIDDENLAFHRRVQQTYRQLALKDPKHWLVIDGDAPEDTVAEFVAREVAERVQCFADLVSD